MFFLQQCRKIINALILQTLQREEYVQKKENSRSRHNWARDRQQALEERQRAVPRVSGTSIAVNYVLSCNSTSTLQYEDSGPEECCENTEYWMTLMVVVVIFLNKTENSLYWNWTHQRTIILNWILCVLYFFAYTITAGIVYVRSSYSYSKRNQKLFSSRTYTVLAGWESSYGSARRMPHMSSSREMDLYYQVTCLDSYWIKLVKGFQVLYSCYILCSHLWVL